jgi:serine/threonine-protein kinase
MAVKAMLPELARNMRFRAMFLEEGQTVRSIQHQNVVRVHDVGETSGILYMAMEWIEGDSLHAIIAEANKRKPIPAELAARVIADTAAGLHAAHEVRSWDGELKNLVHCDVSPHNIIVGRDGAVKLVDFGVASAVDQLAFSEPGTVRGKFGYMSPEQTRGEKIDRTSDIFSLGIVLFELTTGRRLFKGEDSKQTVEMVRRARVPNPLEVIPDYPEKLAQIVLKALERERHARFQTAEEMRQAIEQYLVSERLVVPRAGVAGLLRRVLRERIEQRRDSLRAAVLELDGANQVRAPAPLVPNEPVVRREDATASTSTHGDKSALTSGSTTSNPGSQPSVGAAQLSELSASPQTMRAPPPPAPLRLGLIHYALAGLIIAGLAFWLGGKMSEPAAPVRVTTQGSHLVEPQPATAPPSQAADDDQAVGVDDDISIINMDSLPKVGAAPAETGGNNVSPVSRGSRPTPTTQQAPTAQPAVADGLNMAQASARLKGAAEMAKMCRRPGAQTGAGKVRVTFDPSGSVSNVDVLPPFAGTGAGACVAQKFRMVAVTPFTGSPTTLQKGFYLAE